MHNVHPGGNQRGKLAGNNYFRFLKIASAENPHSPAVFDRNLAAHRGPADGKCLQRYQLLSANTDIVEVLPKISGRTLD